MKHHEIHLGLFWGIFVGSLFCLLATGCVSVNIGNKDVSRAGSVKYVDPPKPFDDITLKSADKAWQNPQTGSTLSFLSICNDSSDPELESLRDSTLRGIDKLQLEADKRETFNGRDALKTSANGSMDGVKVRIHLMIFKKNFCSYTLSMVGVQSKMSKADELTFDNFLKGFQAP